MTRRKLVSTTKKAVKLDAIHPNEGVEAAYRKKLQELAAEMSKSFIYWTRAAWKKGPPVMAQDGAIVDLRKAMQRLAKHWQSRFDSLSDDLAEVFVSGATATTDAAMMASLKRAGFTVNFQTTQAAREGYQAVLRENVSLIRSISSEYLTQVQGDVWRSVSQGYDLEKLTNKLQESYGVTHRRAAFIARDQSNKAKAVIENVRRQELGITTAIWQHSGAGKEPRPSHVAANGKVFELAKGMFLDDEWVLPGQAINCLPGDSAIEFAAGCKKLWRRRYSGDLTEIVTASGKSIKATPNHPVLTGRGWLPIQSVNVGDDVIRIGEQIVGGVEANVNRDVAKFSEIFDAVANYIRPVAAVGIGFEFHGDHADGEVETVNIDGFLPSEVDTDAAKTFCELFFAEADHVVVGPGFNSDGALASAVRRLFGAPEGIVRGFSSLLPLLLSHGSHADEVCFCLSSYLNSALDKAKANAGTSCAEALGQLQLAQSGLVPGNDQIVGELFNLLSRASGGWYGDTPSADRFRDSIASNTEMGRRVLDGLPASYELDRVVDKSAGKLGDHVFNLENGLNWYSSNTCIVHNCRCTSRAVIPGFED